MSRCEFDFRHRAGQVKSLAVGECHVVSLTSVTVQPSQDDVSSHSVVAVRQDLGERTVFLKDTALPGLTVFFQICSRFLFGESVSWLHSRYQRYT